jgi:hypothetical protein
MKLLVTIDRETFERKVDPKKAEETARGIIEAGYQSEGELGATFYPPHRIQLVRVVSEADDPQPKAKAKK